MRVHDSALLICSSLLFTELIDKCIGSRIHIVMKSDKEIVGVLLGFDDYVSILVAKSNLLWQFCVHHNIASEQCLTILSPQIYDGFCFNLSQ